MSVVDNVAYGLGVRRRPEAEVTARVREALDLVQLGDLGARSASKLSGGQQQRVALARAPSPGSVNVWPARIRQRVSTATSRSTTWNWDGRRLIVRSAASEPMAEGEEVFVSADPRDCVLLEEEPTERTTRP
jgi:hypothetical protein